MSAPTYLLTIPAKLAARLARTMGFETTETRNSDSLDFRDISIKALMTALQTAYLAGYDAGQADADANASEIDTTDDDDADERRLAGEAAARGF